jgi:cell division control protein 7
MASTRSRYAQVPFEIHEDGMEMDESAHRENYKDENYHLREEAQDDESDGYSEASEESDGVVDSGVQEDMLRLEETFKGIKERFRLINRIGEGMYYGKGLRDQRATNNL